MFTGLGVAPVSEIVAETWTVEALLESVAALATGSSVVEAEQALRQAAAASTGRARSQRIGASFRKGVVVRIRNVLNDRVPVRNPSLINTSSLKVASW
jgi:hypothetical protein